MSEYIIMDSNNHTWRRGAESHKLAADDWCTLMTIFVNPNYQYPIYVMDIDTGDGVIFENQRSHDIGKKARTQRTMEIVERNKDRDSVISIENFG